jgi:hypothetical protein
MVVTAETECGAPMARMPGAEMAAEMAAAPIMEMRRPVMSDMAMVHRVAMVVKIVVMKIVVTVKVAAEETVAEAAEMTAKTVRHAARGRECDSKQTESGGW